MLPKCISAKSRIKEVVWQRIENSIPMDQPQRKPVGRWCLAGSVERSGVAGWQIEVVAVMRRWRSDGRNLSGTVDWPCMQLNIMTLSL